MIKQNESELANTVFKIQPNKADSFFCFLLFVQSFNCLHLWDQLPNLCGVFTKLKPKQYANRKCQKTKIIFFVSTHFAWSHHNFVNSYWCLYAWKYCCKVLRSTIEGLHDAVRTYTRTTLPRSLVSFYYGTVWRKTTKPAVTFDLLYSKIWNFNWVCVLILLSLGRNLVLWYELNKKVTRHFVVFCYTRPCERKPTWRSRVGWLAKLAWYDVTWKPSICKTIPIHYILYLVCCQF